MHLSYAAANRDPEMFADPTTLDLDRKNATRHVAFSVGETHCPGAGLSRVEQIIALNAILDRTENLRFTPDRNDFTPQPGFTLRALKELHISFDRRV